MNPCFPLLCQLLVTDFEPTFRSLVNVGMMGTIVVILSLQQTMTRILPGDDAELLLVLYFSGKWGLRLTCMHLHF